MMEQPNPKNVVRVAMAKIERDAPSGYDWGWYSREDPRMHLQTIGGQDEYKVWLEEKGRRAFVPSSGIPPKVLAAIRDRVKAHRKNLEYRWCAFAISSSWMAVSHEGDLVSVTVYPRTSGQFVRTVDLRAEFPAIADRARPFLDAEESSLVLYESPRGNRVDLALPSWLWGDTAI